MYEVVIYKKNSIELNEAFFSRLLYYKGLLFLSEKKTMQQKKKNCGNLTVRTETALSHLSN